MAFKVQVISKRSNFRKSWCWTCITNDTPQKLVRVFSPTSNAQFTEKLAMNQFFMLLNVTRSGDNITLDHERSRVVKTSGFAVDEQQVEEFRHAKVVAISTILKTAPKRRLSLEGTVTEIGVTKTGEGWACKRLKISAEDGCLGVTMWGNEIELVAPLRLGAKVSISNVITENYHGIICVNSTAETSIETMDGTFNNRALVLDGFDIQGGKHTIYEADGTEFYISVDLFARHEISSMTFPQSVCCNVVKNEIIAFVPTQTEANMAATPDTDEDLDAAELFL